MVIVHQAIFAWKAQLQVRQQPQQMVEVTHAQLAIIAQPVPLLRIHANQAPTTTDDNNLSAKIVPLVTPAPISQ
jgi:hypothetical protein